MGTVRGRRPEVGGFARLAGMARAVRISIAFVAAAGLAWLVGALPWLVHGARLPTSSLWPDLSAGRTPRVALPMGEYEMGALVAMQIVGGFAGVALPRLLRLSPRGSWVPALGAVTGLGVALGCTAVVIGPHLASAASLRLLVQLFFAAGIGAGLLGVVAGVVSDSGRRWVSGWGPGLAGGLLAGVSTYWVSDLVVSDSLSPNGFQVHVLEVGRWLVLPILAAALVLCWARGARVVVRVLGWVLALGVAWVLPAMLTAADFPGPMLHRSMDTSDGIREIVTATLQVFRGALAPDNHLWLAYALAPVVALGWLLGRVRRP